MELVDQKKIKEQNILQICELLFNSSALSRSEISQASGLSLMTVGKIVELLKSVDIVYEEKDISSTIGRKAARVCVNSENKNIVIIDLSKTNFSYSLMPIYGNQIQTILEYPSDDMDGYTENLRQSLHAFKEHGKDLFRKTLGVGVLVPGPYYADDDIVITKKIPQMESVPVKRLISESFPDAVIWIDEDVKFASRYAMRYVKDFPRKTIFYAYLSEGVGGAVVQEMTIYNSAYSYAGDWGQLRLTDALNVEEAVGTSALIKMYPEDFHNGKLKNPGIFYKKRKEDLELRRFLQDTRSSIIHGLNSIMWLIDPDVIIFDSPYSDWFPNFFDELLADFKKKASAQRGRYIPELVRFRSMENAPYRGARDFVVTQYLKTLSAL